MNKTANFEKEIRQILKGKLKGFKTVGGISGGLLGYGIGGSKGLYDAVKADREGEMEGLEKIDKAKEYLKRIMVPGAIGLGVGAAGGAGIGAAIRNIRPGKFIKNMRKDFMSGPAQNIPKENHDSEFNDFLKFQADDLEETDLIKGIKKSLKSQLFNKTAQHPSPGKFIPRTIGGKRVFGTLGAGVGGALGGAAGGLVGGLKGLVSPDEDEEIDPATEKMVRKSRLASALANAGKGALIGGGLGAIGGGGLAALRAHQYVKRLGSLPPGETPERMELIDNLRDIKDYLTGSTNKLNSLKHIMKALYKKDYLYENGSR